MIIAIPTKNRKGLNDEIEEHFGRCNTYTFLDENGNVIKIVENVGKHMGGFKLPPEFIKDQGAEILLCKGIGPKAVNLCKSLGIKVYISNEAKTVKEIFEFWKNKKVKDASYENTCLENY